MSFPEAPEALKAGLRKALQQELRQPGRAALADESAGAASPVVIVQTSDDDAWLLQPAADGSPWVWVRHAGGLYRGLLSLEHALMLVALLQPSEVWRAGISASAENGDVRCVPAQLLWRSALCPPGAASAGAAAV